MMIELKFEKIGSTTHDKILIDPRPDYTFGSITDYIENRVKGYMHGIKHDGLISWRCEGSIRWKLLVTDNQGFDGGGGI